MHTNERFWRFPIFQIPAFLTILFITLAIIARLLGWFTPSVSVYIALDLSNSTYGDAVNFGKADTVMMTQIEAVKQYSRRNAGLPMPNLITVAGFSDNVIPITNQFSSNPLDIETALDQVIQPSLISQLGGGTNLDAAVSNGLSQLSTQAERCKEIVVVTDGEAVLNPQIREKALINKIKLNFLIINAQKTVPRNLEEDASRTRGVALIASPENFVLLLSQKIFDQFNKNSFILFFVGLAWISFTWSLVIPIERFLRKVMKQSPFVASRVVVLNTVFWTVFTPIALFLLGFLSNLGTC